MKKLLVSALLGLGMIAPASAQSIGGSYTVNGTNLDGSPYAGTAEITLTSSTTCAIHWVVGSTSEGICSRNDDAFAAAYVLGDAIGLVVYKVNGRRQPRRPLDDRRQGRQRHRDPDPGQIAADRRGQPRPPGLPGP